MCCPVAAQIDAGLLAPGRDRDIAASYDTSANRTEIRLTIAPSGSGGPSTVTLVFVARFPGQTPAASEATYSVRTHFTPRADPADRDPRTGSEGRELIFRLDPHTTSGVTLYTYASSWGYPGFVAPGGEIPVAFFSLTAADLRALSTARAITGRALGSEFALAPDQLAAIGEFAKRVVR